jgi:hypothetical protein
MKQNSCTRTIVRQVVLIILVALASKRIALGQPVGTAHLISQVQPVGRESASVSLYAVVKGELLKERELLVTRDPAPFNVISTMSKVGDYVFMTYMDGGVTAMRVFDWRTGKLFDPFAPGIGGAPLLDYSNEPGGGVCANWPVETTPATWDSVENRWSPGHENLISVCAEQGKGLSVEHNHWDQIISSLCSGSYIGNTHDDAECLLHLSGQGAIPADISSPPIAFASVPKELADDAPRGVLQVVGANETYLILRGQWSEDQQTLFVMDRRTREWKTLLGIDHAQYRIFGSLLAADDVTCTIPDDDKELRRTCVSAARAVISLGTGKTTLLPRSTDSEVVDIESDGTMLYREGDALYVSNVGEKLDRNRDLLTRDEMVKYIHWAYYR